MARHCLIPVSLLSFTLFFTSLSPTSSSTFMPSSPALSPDSSDKVSLDLYYEALCPYSANFIINYLAKIFDDQLTSIVHLNLVPWGNAKLRGYNTFDCQHGPSECLLNTIEACAIKVWPDLNKHFSFIYCVETLVYEHKFPEWETCYQKLNLDPTPVADCYSSGYGKELELQYAAETNALQPPHTYVPWVTVNGQPLYDDYENFISYICEAYKGTTVPNACTELSLSIIRKEKANPTNAVCYTEERTKSKLSSIRSAITSWMPQVNMEALL